MRRRCVPGGPGDEARVECALFRAATHGDVEVLEVLLQHGAIVNANKNDPLANWSALMAACRHGCLFISISVIA